MHIIFVTSEIPTKDNYGGGLATFTANIAEIFVAKGNKVEILYVTTKEINEEYDCGVEVRNIFIDKRDWDAYDAVSRMYYEGTEADINRREILSIMKAREVRDEVHRIHMKEKVDLVHFCNHGAFSMLMGTEIPYVIRISGFLNIIFGGAGTPNGSLRYEDNPLSIEDQKEAYALKRAPYVIAPSKLVADIGKSGMGLHVDVLESPFIMEQTKWDTGVYDRNCLEKKKYVLFYGNLRYLKGIQVIADLVGDYLQKWTNRYLVLIGTDMNVTDDAGETVKASEYVKQKAGKNEDRVLYLGRVRRNELYPIIAGAEFCLFPSRIENLSNACIESMALGKIVVATGGASFEQLISDGENGFLCERDNADSFLRGIAKVMQLSLMEKSAIENNARKTIQRLEPNQVYENFRKYYEHVIEEFAINRKQ